MNNNVVEIISLQKQFGEHVVLKNINLSVKKGELFCIVGPDGAGKSTLVKTICSIVPFTSGEIFVFGRSTTTHRNDIKPLIGYLSQRFSLYPDLTVEENIDFHAEIYREKNYDDRKEELLEFVRLIPFRNRLAYKLSGGMKQKLALACTLIHKPQLLLLDEPTTGVDPVSRRDFWKILSRLMKTGITIFLSTPYLDEAERGSRVALMDKGEILLCDSPDFLRTNLKRNIFEIIITDPRKAYYKLQDKEYIQTINLFGDRLHISFHDELSGTNELHKNLTAENITIISERKIIPSLEDVFISTLSD